MSHFVCAAVTFGIAFGINEVLLIILGKEVPFTAAVGWGRDGGQKNPKEVI